MTRKQRVFAPETGATVTITPSLPGAGELRGRALPIIPRDACPPKCILIFDQTKVKHRPVPKQSYGKTKKATISIHKVK